MIASDMMARDVDTIHPGAGMQQAARLLSLERMSGAPVVDGHGTCHRQYHRGQYHQQGQHS
jgi:CBS domain-containing protein